MAYSISIGSNTWTLISPDALVPTNGFASVIMNRCPHTNDANPPNSCNSLRSIDFYNTLVSQGGANGQVGAIQSAASNAAFDSEDYSDGIAALIDLQGYYSRINDIATEKRNWLLWMRGQSKKGRCCQNYASMQAYVDESASIISYSETYIEGLETTIQSLRQASEAYYSAETDDLDLERYRAEVNSTIASSNARVAQTEFLASELAVTEGSKRLLFVVMALVAAFFVYRFVFKR